MILMPSREKLRISIRLRRGCDLKDWRCLSNPHAGIGRTGPSCAAISQRPANIVAKNKGRSGLDHRYIAIAGIVEVF
jgi:hypothetical protein